MITNKNIEIYKKDLIEKGYCRRGITMIYTCVRISLKERKSLYLDYSDEELT